MFASSDLSFDVFYVLSLRSHYCSCLCTTVLIMYGVTFRFHVVFFVVSGFVWYFRFFVSFDRLFVFQRISSVEHVFCGTAGGVPCFVLYID